MLYAFDEVTEALELLPIAARRALDHAGRRLSRVSWTSLSVERRRRIVALGAAREIDVGAVREAVESARPPAEEQEPLGDPAADTVPDAVLKAFGEQRPVSGAVWSALLPLDRYALLKASSSSRAERVAAAYDEIVGASAASTHVGPKGGARMVNVGDKPETRRTAIASSSVTMSTTAFEKLSEHTAAKGDVLAAARIAGIMGAKRTPDLIPLCHPISLSRVTVEFVLHAEERTVGIRVEAEALDRTGVEMEAMTGASVAALTIYDMLKSIDRGMTIGPTRLLKKTGGRSGEFSV